WISRFRPCSMKCSTPLVWPMNTTTLNLNRKNIAEDLAPERTLLTSRTIHHTGMIPQREAATIDKFPGMAESLATNSSLPALRSVPYLQYHYPLGIKPWAFIVEDPVTVLNFRDGDLMKTPSCW